MLEDLDFHTRTRIMQTLQNTTLQKANEEAGTGLEAEIISRNVMSSKSRHVRRNLHTAVYTKLRKLCTADDADSRCQHSLREDETTDILPIA